MTHRRPRARQLIGFSSAGLLLAWGVAFVAVSPAGAVTAGATRYVATTGSDTTGDVPNDCLASAAPCQTVGHAVDEADSGDTVSVAAGTYPESVEITKSLKISGVGGPTVSGDDDPTFTVETPDQGSPPTVTFTGLSISGNTGDDGVLVEDASTVTVEDGNVDNNDLDGVEAEDDSTVTVAGANVDDNAGVSEIGPDGPESAGIMATGDSTVTVTGSNVDDNKNTAEGGEAAGIARQGNSVVTVEKSTLSGNDDGLASGQDETSTQQVASIRAAASRDGGILPADADGADVVLSESTVSNNSDLGVVIAQDGFALIDHSTISGNGSVGVGVVDALVGITTSTISGNRPSDDDPLDEGEGIGIVGDSTEDEPLVDVEESTISGNSGEGVLSDGATLVGLISTTISGTVKPADETGPTGTDDAFPYAGVVQSAVEPGIARSAIARNLGTAAAAKPAAAADSGEVVLEGSIVAQQGKGVPDCAGTIEEIDYNLSSDHSCGFTTANHSRINAKAVLGALTNNGGPTKTQLPGKGSAAIDAVPASADACTDNKTDQRGVAKPQPAGQNCDIGAVEVAESPIVIHPSKLPHATAGKAYLVTLTATGGDGGPYAWSLAPGSTLPPDLKLSSAGVISGTPTKSGTFSFTVSVDDPVLKKFTLVVAAAEGTAPLASTGSDLVPLLGGGSGLVLAGGLFLLAAGFTRRKGLHRAA